MPVNYRIIDNKKYMWDGKEYADEGEALNMANNYKKDKFEVQLIQEVPNEVTQEEPLRDPDAEPKKVAPFGKSRYLIYTRRIAAATTTTT